jgi:hypothetical protein
MSFENLALANGLPVCFARTGEDIMKKYSFRMSSGGIHNIVERSPEQIAERERLSALRRDEKRMLRKIEKMNQGKQDE